MFTCVLACMLGLIVYHKFQMSAFRYFKYSMATCKMLSKKMATARLYSVGVKERVSKELKLSKLGNFSFL